MSEIQNLRTFLMVNEMGSFLRAANALNVSQPAVSKRIRALEISLDCQLFERENTKFQLSEHGRVVAEEARGIVESYFKLRQLVSRQSIRIHSLEIGVIEAVLMTWFPNFLLTLRETYPEIDINLHCSPTNELERKLKEREIDMAFMMGPSTDGEKVYVDCNTVGMCFLADKRLDVPEDLGAFAKTGLSLITFPAGSRPHTDLMFALRSFVPPRSMSFISSTSIGTMLHMVRSLQGVAVMPRDFLDSEDLQEIDFDIQLPPLSFAACFLKSRANPIYSDISQMALEAAKSWAE